MPIARASRFPDSPIGLLRARAHFLPWILLAAVVGISVAGAQREGAVAQAELLRSGAHESATAAVHCDLRQGFVLRLAVHAMVLARSVLPADAHGHRTHGATCHVQP